MTPTPSVNSTIIVIKRNLEGQETWRYSGTVLFQDSDHITLEARFNRPDIPFHGILLGQGDRFIETFYTDHWYNIFEIHAREDDHIKGWYCNICYPAIFSHPFISYIDLALDLLVYPDRTMLVLDEVEFQQLDLSLEDQLKAVNSLAELEVVMAKYYSFPFK